MAGERVVPRDGAADGRHVAGATPGEAWDEVWPSPEGELADAPQAAAAAEAAGARPAAGAASSADETVVSLELQLQAMQFRLKAVEAERASGQAERQEAKRLAHLEKAKQQQAERAAERARRQAQKEARRRAEQRLKREAEERERLGADNSQWSGGGGGDGGGGARAQAQGRARRRGAAWSSGRPTGVRLAEERAREQLRRRRAELQRSWRRCGSGRASTVAVGRWDGGGVVRVVGRRIEAAVLHAE